MLPPCCRCTLCVLSPQISPYLPISPHISPYLSVFSLARCAEGHGRDTHRPHTPTPLCAWRRPAPRGRAGADAARELRCGRSSLLLSPHLPTSPHISPHLEALAERGSHISPHLPTSRGPRCGAHKTAVFRPPLERTRIERPSAAGSVALAPMTLTRCHKCTAHAHGAHVEVASSRCVRLASGGEADIVDRCVNVCNCRRRG